MLDHGVRRLHGNDTNDHRVALLRLPVRIVCQFGRRNVPEGHAGVFGQSEWKNKGVDRPDIILAHFHGHIEVLVEVKLEHLELV